MRGVISGKRILVVDDSVVRSTTITRVIKMLRRAGAKEIHVRVAEAMPFIVFFTEAAASRSTPAAA